MLRPPAAWAQTPTAPAAPAAAAPRSIHRALPLPAGLRDALAGGIRDSSGRPGPRYWQLRPRYTIHARLNPATATVTGRETIVLANPSATTMHGIRLRLDQNLYRADARRHPFVQSSDTTDGMTLTRVAVNGRAIALGRIAGRTTTVATVPAVVPPGGRVRLEVTWHFRVPQRVIRMGRVGDSVYVLGQWYPRVMVYDDLNGWDTEPYLGAVEFYNNYGRFDVTLDLPAGWLVGATGVLQNPTAVFPPAVRARLAQALASDSVRPVVGAAERGVGRATAGSSGGRLLWRFVADTASDFAWVASDRYVWDAASFPVPGRGPVPVHFLYLPQGYDYATVERVARHALPFYSGRIMPYAFPQLTAVQGIPFCCMEYPMLITTGDRTTDHEISHQWWPMMVGSNETWYGWMDEQFSEGYTGSLEDLDGRALSHDGPGQTYGGQGGVDRQEQYSAPYVQSKLPAPGDLRAMLSMLGGIVGDSAVYRALREYSRAWRFKHPSPWDFAWSFNTTLKQDLDWFWYAWMFSPTLESVDGGIDTVTTAGTRTTVVVRQAGQMPAPVVLAVELAPSGPAVTLPPNARLVDSVTAMVTYPVDVWLDGRRTFAVTLDFGRPVVRLTLDPRKRFPDREPADNVWPR